jgi:hypothetical protein
MLRAICPLKRAASPPQRNVIALHGLVGPMDLALPGPSAKQWALAAGLTLSAPDHGGLRPFRVRVVGDSWREVLVGLAAMGAQQRGQTAEEVERTGVRAFNRTGLAALGTHVRDDVPPHEQ